MMAEERSKIPSLKGSNSGVKMRSKSTHRNAETNTEAAYSCTSCAEKDKLLVNLIAANKKLCPEAIEGDYISAINYINSCHDMLNQLVENNKFTSPSFKLPTVPNFVSVFTAITKTAEAPLPYPKSPKPPKLKIKKSKESMLTKEKVIRKTKVIKTGDNGIDLRQKTSEKNIKSTKTLKVESKKGLLRFSGDRAYLSSDDSHGSRISLTGQRSTNQLSMKTEELRAPSHMSGDEKSCSSGISVEDLNKYANDLLETSSISNHSSIRTESKTSSKKVTFFDEVTNNGITVKDSSEGLKRSRSRGSTDSCKTCSGHSKNDLEVEMNKKKNNEDICSNISKQCFSIPRPITSRDRRVHKFGILSTSKQGNLSEDSDIPSDTDNILDNVRDTKTRVTVTKREINPMWHKNEKNCGFASTMYNRDYKTLPPKSNPFVLNERSIGLLDDKMIDTIGVFEKNGELKSNIIESIEKVKAKSNIKKFHKVNSTIPTKYPQEKQFCKKRVDSGDNISYNSLQSVSNISIDSDIKTDDELGSAKPATITNYSFKKASSKLNFRHTF